jgi:serine/threonine protein phosphatase PrpC
MVHCFEVTTSERQLGEIQDMICSGKNEETGITWMVCGDGHGVGLVVTKARKYNWAALGELPGVDIQTIIQPFVDEISSLSDYDDGMTCTIIRCRSDSTVKKTMVELAWIGDSEVAIGRTSGPNTGLVFRNNGYKIHETFKNSVTSEDTFNFEVIDDDTCRALRDQFFIFPTGKLYEAPVKINMTGSLGHKGVTTHALFQRVFEVDNDESFIIRVATDGLWQMLHEGDLNDVLNPNISSQDLTQKVEKRWKKSDWNFDPNFKGMPTYMWKPMLYNQSIDEPDDIAVGTIIIYPKPKPF